MIPEEVEDRIARFYFYNYLPDDIMYELEMLPLPLYISDYGDEQEDPPSDEVVKIAIEFLMEALDEEEM